MHILNICPTDLQNNQFYLENCMRQYGYPICNDIRNDGYVQ